MIRTNNAAPAHAQACADPTVELVRGMIAIRYPGGTATTILHINRGHPGAADLVRRLLQSVERQFVSDL
jgi:hypothetical protein